MEENNNQVAEKRECENCGATHRIGENTLCDDMVTIPRAEYERLLMLDIAAQRKAMATLTGGHIKEIAEFAGF